MKFLTRRKKKEKDDEDLHQPPHVGPSANTEPHVPQQQQQVLPETYAGLSNDHSSYRYALSAYARTISPALSNEDGFGGGATLRSRSTKSGGKKHKTLIPEIPPTPFSDASFRVEMDRYGFSSNAITEQNEMVLSRADDGEEWAPVPQEPMSPADMVDDSYSSEDDDVDQEQVIGQSSSEATSEQRKPSKHSSSHIHFQPSPTYQPLNNVIPNSRTQSTNCRNSTTGPNSITLQPDAIYKEHYGDAYVDQYIKYLYPIGYQSMRPRSGPFKLSIFVFGLFMWLSVFIVGHCYDRGQEYSTYFGRSDDAYLSEVDDDMLVMETRWCGSKLIYFMWFICVSITMLAMSYCSIIGYIKLRDVAVANGRSQPPDMTSNTSGRSDCYANIDNVNNTECDDAKSSISLTSGYSSYQDGGLEKRYPNIYQSDGTPQFWGGHIYRPTQAAVSMTNR